MQKQLLNLKRQGYEAPKSEIITIETQCVLCASAPGVRTTESMNLTDINWP